MDRARTVVVSGVPGHVLPARRTADKLTIHFQSRRRSHGGDVSEVTYPTSMEGVAFVTFDHPEDAARAVKKERQIMTDGAFPDDYDLTVFPFSDDVFLYVSAAKVDLSFLDGDQSSLIESLRSAHRSLRFRPLPREKAAEIEGPFAAVKALRTDLLGRVGSLDSVKLAGANLNPEVAAHPEASVSFAASEAKGPAASGSLSGLPQRTGEASEAQSLLSKEKTPNDFLTQTASGGILPREKFWDGDEEDGLRKLARRRSNSLRRQVVGEESNPRFLPSLSDLNLLPAEDVKRQKAPTRRESYSASKYVEGPSGAAVPSERDSTSSGSEGRRPSLSPEGRRDIWLDSYTFQYVEKFYKTKLEACLTGVTASVKHLKESDLLRVSLTAIPNSPGGVGVDEAHGKLQELMSYWQLILSIYQVDYKKTELNGEEELTQICKDVGSRFGYVLSVIEGSCVKVIGLPTSTRLFSEEIKDRIAQCGSLKM